jgi:hypothetical protein
MKVSKSVQRLGAKTVWLADEAMVPMQPAKSINAGITTGQPAQTRQQVTERAISLLKERIETLEKQRDLQDLMVYKYKMRAEILESHN